MVVVLMVASGAGWESTALRLLDERPGVVVLRRCVDVDDLLAAATAGQADVAVVGLDAPGLDPAAVELLRRHRVRLVAVAPADCDADASRVGAARLGVHALVPEGELDTLPGAVSGAVGLSPTLPERPDAVDPAAAPAPDPADGGRVLAVWGPAGAPGRTTVAVGIAAELARRRLRTVLVDADPYGGAVAQQLGILDEVSGLLSAARLASAGRLAERFASVQRGVGTGLTVVTGLPRADRWVELRSGALEHLLEVAREHGRVVVDTGFSLEDDPGSEFGTRPGRNQMTLAALGVADEVIVVGTADPVGLSRLARALVELRDLTGGRVRVVVNRMRSSLGWSEKEVAGMVSGFTRLAGLHFLPDDRITVDRALVAGRTLPEVGDSALGRAVAGIVDALEPGAAAPSSTGRVRRRTAGRARPR